MGLIRDRFHVEIATITRTDLLAVRQAIDDAKWRYAFGEDHNNHPLTGSLLWHFGFWKLSGLHKEQRRQPNEVLRPGLYRNVVVLMADLCAFSSYVRDSPDNELIRRCLTKFYSPARYTVLNTGGMMYQFVGDQVIGLYGVPDPASNALLSTIDCARGLIDIGNSVSNLWQSQLDRVQKSAGVHIGIAIGDLDLVELRPFSNDRIGFVGDALNVAARLMDAAGPSEIVVGNTFYQQSDPMVRKLFHEMPPVEGKNVGAIRCWNLGTA